MTLWRFHQHKCHIVKIIVLRLFDLLNEFKRILWVWDGNCGRHDTQHNDIQHNDIQHNDTQHNGLVFDTKHNSILNWVSLCSVSLCSVSRLIYCYAECHCAECHCAERHYAACHCAECRYAECHYAERHGTKLRSMWSREREKRWKIWRNLGEKN